MSPGAVHGRFIATVTEVVGTGAGDEPGKPHFYSPAVEAASAEASGREQ